MNACLHSSLFRSIMDIQVNKCSKVHKYIFSKYRAATFYRINNKHHNNTTITGVYPTMYFATKIFHNFSLVFFFPHHFFLLFLKKGTKGENITFQEAVTLWEYTTIMRNNNTRVPVKLHALFQFHCLTLVTSRLRRILQFGASFTLMALVTLSNCSANIQEGFCF